MILLVQPQKLSSFAFVDHLYFSSTTDDMLISIDPNTGNSTIYCTFGNLNLRSKEI